MHTALECEVTIKPRFVYIPSPRTGPMRGGYCESRDGRGVERETGTWESRLRPSGIRALGFPQLLQSAAAASRGKARGAARGAPRLLVCARGCSGVGGRAASAPRAAPSARLSFWWRLGSEGVTAGRAAAVRGLRAGCLGAQGGGSAVRS